MYRILELNPQLQSFAWDIDYRMELYRNAKARILGVSHKSSPESNIPIKIPFPDNSKGVLST